MTSAFSPVFLRDWQSQSVPSACSISLDMSRQRFTQAQFEQLLALGNEKGLLKAEAEMQSGAVVNPSENRQALHTALRDPSPQAPHHEEVAATLQRIAKLAREIRTGNWKGSTGLPITDVINVGIGGSEMGPKAVWHALQPKKPDIHLHFLSAADGVQFDRITANVDANRTLVVVSSKSFTTRETAANAAAILQWLKDHGIAGSALSHHMVLVTANLQAAEKMELPLANVFPMWNWVGGRFSVWSAIGLPLAVALGEEVFREFLLGAHEMDQHALRTPIEQNLPALMALLEYGNIRFHGIQSLAFLPYDERLRVLVDWLQQLEMESLGKSVPQGAAGKSTWTGLAVWGGHADEGQHSYFQWLREGTCCNCIDIVSCNHPGHAHTELSRVLAANAHAQAEALVTRPEGSAYFNAVNSLELESLTARSLGAFMALYEHKTTMLGTLFGINPFDQPGVELGKKLSRQAEAEMIASEKA